MTSEPIADLVERLRLLQCPSRKIRHLTVVDAQLHIQELQRKKSRRRPKRRRPGQLNPYLCEQCGGWHVGHSERIRPMPETPRDELSMLSFKLSPELHDALCRVARERDMTVSAVIRAAIRGLVEPTESTRPGMTE